MRARNIKPGFWENEVLGRASHTDRLLFIGLWCLADRDGKLEDREDKIRHLLFGYDRRPVDVEKSLRNLMSLHVITRYDVSGHRYIHIPNFKKHQQPHPHEAKSKIPDPVDSRDMSLHVSECHSDSLNPDSLNDEESKRQTLSSPGGDPTPQKLADFWNEKADPTLARVREMTGSRLEKTRTRLKEHPDGVFWKRVLDKINASSFLRGNQKGRTWKVSFDWIIENDKNAVKIAEGQYDDKTATNGQHVGSLHDRIARSEGGDSEIHGEHGKDRMGSLP